MHWEASCVSSGLIHVGGIVLHMKGEEGESAEGSSEDSHALLVKQLGGKEWLSGRR